MTFAIGVCERVYLSAHPSRSLSLEFALVHAYIHTWSSFDEVHGADFFILCQPSHNYRCWQNTIDIEKTSKCSGSTFFFFQARLGVHNRKPSFFMYTYIHIYIYIYICVCIYVYMTTSLNAPALHGLRHLVVFVAVETSVVRVSYIYYQIKRGDS